MKTKIYLASALFTVAEQEYNKKLEQALIEKGYEVFLPQEKCEGFVDSNVISFTCKQGINDCNIMIANLEGSDVDSGTAWECGYANALDIPVIGIRTDFRQRGDDGGLNCILSQNAIAVINDIHLHKIVEHIEIIIITLNKEK